jgi:hypothetical protein
MDPQNQQSAMPSARESAMPSARESATPSAPQSATPSASAAQSEAILFAAHPALLDEPYRGLHRIFIGPQGMRAGWSVLLFFLLFMPLNVGIDAVLLHLHLIGKIDEFTPRSAFFSEAGGLLALVVAVALVGLVEGRRVQDYNLSGVRRSQHLLFGVASGYVALSALIGALAAGGWLHLGRAAFSTVSVFRFSLLWGCVFLAVACFEEGMFRCYGLFTLARGIDFRWAFGILAVTCSCLAVFVGGAASWGVYLPALLGCVPCLILSQRSSPSRGFWCAAWVTSTLFGLVHIGNSGEAWIGIFAAAFIGFVFCVSVRVTGSAWWAIGCHAAWDWSETFFYGTADSGLKPHGSYLTSTPAGNPFWSGGAVGPEGSVLVLGAILLLLVLLLVYGRLSQNQSCVLRKA